MLGIPSIYLLSAAAALVAVVGFLVVHKVAKPIDIDEHQGFLDAMLNIVGTLISILLGLLVAAALDRYQSLEQSIDNEAASVAQLYRISGGLPSASGSKIRELCFRYCDQVINDEWPAMAEGHPSQKVFTTYVEMVGEIVRFQPKGDGESNLHNSLLAAMQQIGDCRRQRILRLSSSWMHQLMPVLLMCSGIVLAFAYMYVRRGAVLHGVLIGLVAIALGGNLGLVFLLSNPFSGDWKILPRSFELNAKMLSEISKNPELIKLMRQD